MKPIKIAATALIIAGGTFAAFAFTSNKESKTTPPPTTYYAIEDTPGSPNFHWSTSVPAGYECVPGKAVCSITATTPPTNNQLPSGVTSRNEVYRLIE
ncbi:hypothetical protein [Chryseobacterium sp. c4a]|uniref:hypothetical protein n=1 Tax=Chryseobacterium sp. c4a TaxID=1573582 RepID=UPI00135C5DDA|nr:hypothetical protein [Chryseobacterium sp. c4a]